MPILLQELKAGRRVEGGYGADDRVMRQVSVIHAGRSNGALIDNVKMQGLTEPDSEWSIHQRQGVEHRTHYKCEHGIMRPI